MSTNLKHNSKTFSIPMSKEAKAFFSSPSKLSKGRRFVGIVGSNFYGKACSDQSGSDQSGSGA